VLRAAVEGLENRALLAASLSSEITDTAGAPGTTGVVELSSHFNDPTINTVARFTTEVGSFDITLFDNLKPNTVANFLQYVRLGLYDGTIIHRSQALDSNAAAPSEIIQGGGYGPPNFSEHISTFSPVANEFTTNQQLSNTIRTVAMAKTSDPDSATSEWFVNLKDNSQALDNTSNSGGFTVFGEVTSATYPTVEAIAALPRFEFSSPFTSLPLRNYTQQDFTAGTQIGDNNLVSVTAEVVPKLTYTVSSSNSTLVAPTITGNKLSLAYGSTFGVAQITVSGMDSNGNTVASTFDATVNLPVVLGEGGSKSLTFTDADGTTSTVSYKGPGTATVSFTGAGVAQTTLKGKTAVTGTGLSIRDITIANSTSKSSLSISNRGGDSRVTLGSLSASGAIKSISAKTTALVGSLTVAGSISSLSLASVANSSISLGGL
jgi:cyclophilin family peptidyl-prolyl cis-trans isomerase